MNELLKKRANELLKDIYGPDAQYREGQYEAIEATVTNKRTIVVQKTGWGKSLVYFVSTKLLKEAGKGMTIVISPLLVLMDNQMEAAEKMGLICQVLDSRCSEDERKQILAEAANQEIDVLFTTPEQLFKEDLYKLLRTKLNIGLFVIDECHCISDWGHDFRLQYGKLNRIISIMPEDVSVIGTTATANDRVIEDLKMTFGDDTYVVRGPLTRESLHIEILRLETKAERYAWIIKNISKLPGSGIIYCSTQRDCEKLADFLIEKGIAAKPYHAGDNLKNEIPSIEKDFMNNKIKVLVATIKLGMGYDKSDIRFVIHFQRPSSLVAYYQQIGRAGRDGEDSYCYLMTGKEDKDIQEYFIKNAFPTKEQEEQVVDLLDESEGLGEGDLMDNVNISISNLRRVLMFLEDQQFIYTERDGSKKYYLSPSKRYSHQGERYEKIRDSKRSELQAVEEYINSKGCLSRYVVERLNDTSAHDCGKCFNCTGKEILEGVTMPQSEDIIAVEEELNGDYWRDIEPKKVWKEKENPFDENTKIKSPNETGIVIAKYGDAGYGEMVQYDKYHADSFRKELVDKAVVELEKLGCKKEYTVVTNIPSARNKKVDILAQQIAESLGMQYMKLLDVTDVETQQKTMENSYFQYKNAVSKIKNMDNVDLSAGTNIILVDDLVDSGWTLAVSGGLLKNAGAGKVLPFCLADSSKN